MTASSKHHNPYDRFIPSEEVQDVVPWSFAAMDGSRGAGPKPLKGPAMPSEPPPPTAADVQAAHQAGYDEGLQAGKIAGIQEAREQLQAPITKQLKQEGLRLRSLIDNQQAQMAQLQVMLSEQVLALACDLARQVVRRELQQPLEPLQAVVQEAIAQMVEAHQTAALRLHPQDAQLLSAEWTHPANVRLVPDPNVEMGGCVLDYPQGQVDATLPARWTRAIANLGLDLPWHPDASPNTDDAEDIDV